MELVLVEASGAVRVEDVEDARIRLVRLLDEERLKRVEAQVEEVMVKAVEAEVEAMRVVVLVEVEVMNGGEWW